MMKIGLALLIVLISLVISFRLIDFGRHIENEINNRLDKATQYMNDSKR